MKKIILGLVILIPCIYILFRTTPLESLFPKEKVSLEIIGQDVPLVLYIDNRLIGTLPLNNITVSPGVHTFALYSVIGEDSTKQWWQEEISVSNEDDLKLVIQSQGELVESVALVRLFDDSRSNLSRIFVAPELVTMTWNDKVYHDFPVVLESLPPGEHVFHIDGDIYSSMDIAVQLPQHMQVEMHVQVFFDYLSSIGKAEGLVIEPRLDASVPISRRWEWGALEAPVPANNLATAPWETIDVYVMNFPQDQSSTGIVKMLEGTFMEQGGLFRIPFCFIVDEIGSVYEGLGIWNYDYSQLSSGITTFYKGGCPVLVVGEYISVAEQRALNYIAAFIKEPPQLQASVESNEQLVQVATEQISDTTVTVKNTGWEMWRNINGQAVRVHVNDVSRRSDIYNPDIWIDVSVATAMEDPLVLPGAETTFVIPFKAPIYPIASDEVFSLYQDENKISGSEITLKMKVTGEGKGVEIQNTPVGFLNVREEPSGNGRLVGSVYPGERYLLLESSGSWHKIRLSDGTEGWVSGDFIKELPI
ncbi:SH3 domain-containing protein [candidate division WWE3 bacterium]|uniref:SH3 domain-containing protein n=1 Tax=candidate division WWE3 bacterium TaxID=2053526 RepID=A0A955LV99_UNCKA|nr:SH3 domain-containing protein [candidate division WWE3 bacterium]